VGDRLHRTRAVEDGRLGDGLFVGGAVHTGGVSQVTGVDAVVPAIEQAVCDALDGLLRTTGAVQPPMVHMFSEGRGPDYVGCVTCRRFVAGEDAYRAVGKLGHLPGTVEATRLLVTWEAQDLNAALQLPVDPDGSALVVLDAAMGGQVLRWYPLYLSRARQGHPALIPGWGPVQTLTDPPLPQPIVRLLAVWRLARGGDGDAQARELEAEGYRISWYGR